MRSLSKKWSKILTQNLISEVKVSYYIPIMNHKWGQNLELYQIMTVKSEASGKNPRNGQNPIEVKVSSLW